MGRPRLLLPLPLLLLLLHTRRSESLTLSSRLIHRYSEEAREIRAAGRTGGGGRGGAGPPGAWPTRGSPGYYRALVRGDDLRRQKRSAGPRYSEVFPSQGSEAVALGNDFGWLHYTWVDIGTPNVSFLVALDSGSDLFWVPCDCKQCAALSGQENGLDKDLSMYIPEASSTSKHLSCNHELCSLAPNCKSAKQPCSYHAGYKTENTSSSGLLVEDILYLASGNAQALIQASVIIGCGSKQTGGYLDGIAPDGLLGLGPGDISVPSMLAREGLIRNSFSLCFEEDDSGRILFGDQGISSQQSTPFVALGTYPVHFVEVEGWCIGAKCLGQTRTKAIVDSGSSFTYLPSNVYKFVVAEFDRQMNSSRLASEESFWDYCYRVSSLETSVIPRVALMLAVNESFVVNNPVLLSYGKERKPDAFCLALQRSADDFVTIGQNLMTGYRMVFDRENMRLGWSQSNCHDADNSRMVPLTPQPHETPENPLPTVEEQSPPSGLAVTPAVAGRAPTKPSAAAPQLVFRFGFLALLLLLLTFSVVFAR